MNRRVSLHSSPSNAALVCVAALATIALIGAPEASAKSAAKAKAKVVEPAKMLAVANAEARRRPDAKSFVDATQVYDYAPGALYELYAAPEFLSTILLEEGETLQTTAAGDTTRWKVEAVPAAGGDGGRTLVLVKPTRPDIRTNIVLATDRRTYLIEAIAIANSGAKAQTYSAQIAWRYPESAQHRAGGPTIALGSLNFRYTIETTKGRRPSWTPDRVYDDGRRTIVEFPATLETGDAPPLFVIGPEGAELANYRVMGNRYVLDRLIDAAELRLGDRKPVVVRIAREGKARVTAGGRP